MTRLLGRLPDDERVLVRVRVSHGDRALGVRAADARDRDLQPLAIELVEARRRARVGGQVVVGERDALFQPGCAGAVLQKSYCILFGIQPFNFCILMNLLGNNCVYAQPFAY